MLSRLMIYKDWWIYKGELEFLYYFCPICHSFQTSAYSKYSVWQKQQYIVHFLQQIFIFTNSVIIPYSWMSYDHRFEKKYLLLKSQCKSQLFYETFLISEVKLQISPNLYSHIFIYRLYSLQYNYLNNKVNTYGRQIVNVF